ncbi:hypothetical protein B0H13DRAFT_1861192 [Mycena leptocephala]|nr:hypothetical protein B0H13DRAFT_1861192 [Mycena leptocephala]
MEIAFSYLDSTPARWLTSLRNISQGWWKRAMYSRRMHGLCERCMRAEYSRYNGASTKAAGKIWVKGFDWENDLGIRKAAGDRTGRGLAAGAGETFQFSDTTANGVDCVMTSGTNHFGLRMNRIAAAEYGILAGVEGNLADLMCWTITKPGQRAAGTAMSSLAFSRVIRAHIETDTACERGITEQVRPLQYCRHAGPKNFAMQRIDWTDVGIGKQPGHGLLDIGMYFWDVRYPGDSESDTMEVGDRVGYIRVDGRIEDWKQKNAICLEHLKHRSTNRLKRFQRTIRCFMGLPLQMPIAISKSKGSDDAGGLHAKPEAAAIDCSSAKRGAWVEEASQGKDVSWDVRKSIPS